MTGKRLEKKGEADYDYKHDILFFKVSEREYSRSIEIENFAIDIDKEDFLVGIQIFEASKFLKIKDKKVLMSIPKWQFEANMQDGRIEIRLTFEIKQRNQIIEKNPIILQNVDEDLPNSRLLCEAMVG